MLCCCHRFSLSNASDGLTPVPTAPGLLRYISLQPSPAPRASGRSIMSVALCLQPSPELAGHGGGRRGWPPCSDKQRALCSPSGVGTQGDRSACLGLEGSWKPRGWGDLEGAGKARGSPPGTASLQTEWAGPTGGCQGGAGGAVGAHAPVWMQGRKPEPQGAPPLPLVFLALPARGGRWPGPLSCNAGPPGCQLGRGGATHPHLQILVFPRGGRQEGRPSQWAGASAFSKRPDPLSLQGLPSQLLPHLRVKSHPGCGAFRVPLFNTFFVSREQKHREVHGLCRQRHLPASPGAPLRPGTARLLLLCKSGINCPIVRARLRMGDGLCETPPGRAHSPEWTLLKWQLA